MPLWLAGLLAGGVTALFNYGSTNATNAANARAQREAQAYEERQTKLANEYNDPAAQAQRMRNAGINPNRSDKISAGVYVTPDTIQRPAADTPDVGNAVETALQVMSFGREMQLQDEQIKTMHAQRLKMLNDSVFNSTMNNEKLKSEHLDQQVKELKKSVLTAQNRMINYDIESAEALSKYSFGLNPSAIKAVTGFLKLVFQK